MITEIQKKLSSIKINKRTVIIVIVALMLIVISMIAQFTYYTIIYDKIHRGIYINDVNVGGMSKASAKSLLDRRYGENIYNTKLILVADGSQCEIGYNELSVSYNTSEAVDNAYNICRKGNVFKRAYEIARASIVPPKLSIPFSFDKNKLSDVARGLCAGAVIKPVRQPSYTLKGDKVVIFSGTDGKDIDTDKLSDDVGKAIKNGTNGTVNLVVSTIQHNNIDPEVFYKKINVEPKNAMFSVENNEAKIIPQQPGVKVDKVALISIAKELEGKQDRTMELKAVITEASVKVEDIEDKLFRDVLATTTTRFYTGSINDSNRANNIRLATSKISGTILGANGTFSFNTVVGPRGVAQGYKTAHTYVGGKIVDGIGGGICQVSSTLYSTALFADLDILERKNHMFVVGYLPYGRDATVSYDGPDLRFKNNTKWPIKVEGTVTTDNRLIFTIRGTNENVGRSIEIKHTTVQVLDPSVKYVDDNTLEQGVEETITNGMKGYVIDTYKIVKQDGKEVSSTKIHRSTYSALDREIRRGTKIGATTTSSTPADDSTPTTDIPSDTPT